MELFVEDKTFEKQDFSQASLPKGDYEYCNFVHCNFSNVHLTGFGFANCTFQNCNLSMVKTKMTSFQVVNFTACKMLGIHFENCNQFGLDFKLIDCTMNHSSFYQVKLKKSIFQNSILKEVDFTEADFSNSQFINCDFGLATFPNTVLEKADFSSSFNYSINPTTNKIRKAKFDIAGLPGLLEQFDIIING